MHVVPAALPYESQDPGPHLLAVLEQEEAQQHGDDQPREQLAEQDRAGSEPPRERAAVRAQPLEALVDAVADVALAEVERRLRQLVRRLPHTILGPRAQIAELASERRRD